MLESRHYSYLYLLVILIAITILSGPLWKAWFVLDITVFFMWLADVLFLTRNMFMYEPNYNFWKEANEVEY